MDCTPRTKKASQFESSVNILSGFYLRWKALEGPLEYILKSAATAGYCARTTYSRIAAEMSFWAVIVRTNSPA